TVGLVALERPVRPGDGRGGWRARTGIVDRGEVDGVLGRPAEDRLLVERVGDFGEGSRPIGARLRPVEVRMKDHLGPAVGRPAYGPRVPPALVADGDPKR